MQDGRDGTPSRVAGQAGGQSCGKEEGADEIELWVGRRWGTSSSSCWRGGLMVREDSQPHEAMTRAE